VPDRGTLLDMSADDTGRVRAAHIARKLHPREGHEGCIELYASCGPAGPQQRCVSAPFYVDCDEAATLPSNGERVYCACP
jgi:hypothetical protein